MSRELMPIVEERTVMFDAFARGRGNGPHLSNPAAMS
jgi:hypothetical protein